MRTFAPIPTTQIVFVAHATVFVGWFSSVANDVHEPAPLAGAVDVQTRPWTSLATQRSAAGHEMSLSAAVLPSDPTLQAAAVPVGFAEKATVPSTATATQNVADTHATDDSGGFPGKRRDVQAPLPGDVEVSTSPSPETRAQKLDEGHVPPPTELLPSAICSLVHAVAPPDGFVE